MNRTRALAAVPLLAVAVLALSACQKPAPGATVYSGTTSVHREAACWAPEGQYLSEDTCSVDELKPPAGADIPAVAGQRMVCDIEVAPVTTESRLRARFQGGL